MSYSPWHKCSVMPNKVANKKGEKKASQGDLLYLNLQGDEAGTSRHRHESSQDMSITNAIINDIIAILARLM